MASEDQTFLTNHGFDMQAIQKAIDHNEESKRIRGASTITQQTAKNLFLWPEAATGFVKASKHISQFYWRASGRSGIFSKTYLNIVELGDGVYGVEAAAQQFFHTSPLHALRPTEAALLAATLPDPHRLKPYAPSAYLRDRQQWILQQMDQLGGINVVNTIP